MKTANFVCNVEKSQLVSGGEGRVLTGGGMAGTLQKWALQMGGVALRMYLPLKAAVDSWYPKAK